MSGRHHRVGLDHYVPAWGLELYRNQRALEARLDEIVVDAHEVRANVQAFIADVRTKMTEQADSPTEDRSAEVDALQAQLDGIDQDIREAREAMAALAEDGPADTPTGEPVDAPQQDDSGVPFPTPVDENVDVVEAPAVVTDPNAPSRAPGFE